MSTGRWGPALLIGTIVVATATPASADQEYVIWRSTTLDRLDWVPGSSTYRSKAECDEAVAVRLGRVAKVVAFLRRIGADDTLLRVVGDRVYECRPALTRARSRPPGSEPGQSP
jgi:hypothetical protein